ncbi:pleiotropic drug resistance ABC transporter [Marasmius fiardii PR-910]|nr:pleiotropic drug resistance ABC transporter [Marasmius fiardii PR-910]
MTGQRQLEILTPTLVLLYTITHDLLVTANPPIPSILQRVWTGFSNLFRNFLHLEDLEEPTKKVNETPVTTTRALVVLPFFQSVGWIGCFVYACVSHDIPMIIQSILASLSWTYVGIRTLVRPPRTPPYLVILFAIIHLFLPLVDLTADDTLRLVFSIASMICPAGFIWFAGTLPLRIQQPGENVAMPSDIPSVTKTCPEDGVTLWSWCTFSFVEPIFEIATKRTLNDPDVWRLSPYFGHKNLFNKYLEYRARHPTHSLLWFLLASNSLDLILDVVLELWSAVVGFLPAYSLKRILAILAEGSSEPRSRAYYWTLATFIAHLSFAQVDLFQQWHTRRCYERTRGQLFCAIHYKALKRQDVAGKTKQEGEEDNNADLGKIVNLMQGDTYAVAQRFWEFSGLFASPVRLAIALVFLYQLMGWAALSGVVIILLAYVLNYPLAKFNVYLTRKSWKAKDARMNIVNELLQNIRFLKFYGWENHWGRKTHELREKELRWRVKQNLVDTIITFIWIWIPSATALVSFLCYTLIAGERLTVSVAFTAIALFSQLQGPMSEIPGQIFALLHAYVSMQRIEQFLKEDEVPEWASTLTGTSSNSDQVDGKLGFSDATFRWQAPPKTVSTPDNFTLGPLDIVFPEGQITLLSGPTGSGKSAILAALLGEMCCISGHVFINKTNHQVAYCAQNPWLEHATIRDNIVFASDYGYDEGRYDAVLEACALKRDLEVFDAGDLTEIGEKGITLSGGQRARIALARAVYSQAKYILLDDPLAAVDMHTAQHLVVKCFSGELMRGRTVILVTHHLGLCLPISSYLVEISHGTVLRQGPIDSFGQREIQEVIEAEDEPFIEEKADESNALPENEADDVKDKAASKPRRADGKLVEVEARAEGRVSLRTYMTYMRAAGIWTWALTFLLMLMIRGINIANQFYVATWGKAYEHYESSAFPGLFTATFIRYPWDDFPPPDINVTPWLLVYFYISLVGAFSVLFYISIGYYASLRASRSLFISILLRLTRAPARFFDVTPIGRILNRFTTDINTIDGALQNSARSCLSGVLNFVASFMVILVVIPPFAPIALFIAWLYIRLAPPYVQASRDLRRLESISLSPAFAGFDELLRGLTHVRAFGMERRYQNAFYAKVDKFQSFDHVYWLVNSWLRWRYDCLGSVVVYATTLFSLWMNVDDGFAAIVIVQAAIFADASRQLVRVAAQLELDFNSVERVIEYLNVPQEAPAIVEGKRPPAYWPSSTGRLVVEDVTVKYASHLPAALRNLTFAVEPCEKIGVVGRTGSAGKSTLALSLLRMIEPLSGTIYMDGIDISKIGLEDLRTRITIVSQDVSLFSGTLRTNLDPLGENSDEDCLNVMRRCHLLSVLNHKSTMKERDLLSLPVSQASLSGGEKQLVALARAVLRRTNIIIMDEATSQIDNELDEKIQRTIREELSSAIVITIAHRLKTIIDYDRILVLSDGEIAEFGTPQELLGVNGGMFREMCRRSPDWPLFASLIENRSR